MLLVIYALQCAGSLGLLEEWDSGYSVVFFGGGFLEKGLTLVLFFSDAGCGGRGLGTRWWLLSDATLLSAPGWGAATFVASRARGSGLFGEITSVRETDGWNLVFLTFSCASFLCIPYS